MQKITLSLLLSLAISLAIPTKTRCDFSGGLFNAGVTLGIAGLLFKYFIPQTQKAFDDLDPNAKKERERGIRECQEVIDMQMPYITPYVGKDPDVGTIEYYLNEAITHSKYIDAARKDIETKKRQVAEIGARLPSQTSIWKMGATIGLSAAGAGLGHLLYNSVIARLWKKQDNNKNDFEELQRTTTELSELHRQLDLTQQTRSNSESEQATIQELQDKISFLEQQVAQLQEKINAAEKAEKENKQQLMKTIAHGACITLGAGLGYFAARMLLPKSPVISSDDPEQKALFEQYADAQKAEEKALEYYRGLQSSWPLPKDLIPVAQNLVYAIDQKESLETPYLDVIAHAYARGMYSH